MERRDKIAVLVAIGICYAVGAPLCVFMFVALNSWGGAWCAICRPGQLQAIDEQGIDVLYGAIAIGAALAIGLVIVGRQWLKPPDA